MGVEYNEKNSILHFRFYFFSIKFNCNHVRLLTRLEYIMRIPTNSNFSKEIAKKLQRIINPQTTLEELQNLQDEMKMINPVDTHLQKQVSKLKEKANGQETSKVANAVRQVHNERKGFVAETVSTKGKEKSYSLETASN